MYLRRDVIREAATATRNETYKLDLPDRGHLSALLIRMSAAGVSDLLYAAGGAWRLIDYISEINVIGNGTTKIKSLTGLQASAMCWFDQGVMPPDVVRNYSTASQWVYLLINFGRKLGDTHVGLELEQWDNVQLQITNTATSTYWGQDIATTVIGYFKEGQGGFPLGYMRSEEYKSWTTVANTWEYTDLPTQNILRRLFLQLNPPVASTNIQKTSMDNMADDIKLTLKTGEIQIYRGGVDDIMRENQMDYGREVVTHCATHMAADVGFYTGVGRVIGRMGISGARDGAVSAVVPTIEGDNSNDTQKLEAREADSPVELTVMGQCPNRLAVFRFDHDDDPNSWLDLGVSKTVKCDVHTRDSSDAASGTNRIVLDTLMPQRAG